MRNLEKGQHIFIAFQNGKAVLDSQLRPRIYTSLENADKCTPTVNKGKIEYVEYAPTLTPLNEWISVEERLPEGHMQVLMWSARWKIAEAGSYYNKHFWVYTEIGDGYIADNITHWMPLPEAPDSRLPEVEEDT